MLDRIELKAELLDLLRARAIRFLHGPRVVTLTFRTGNLVARRVLLPLQPLEFGNEAAARRLERGDLLERLVGIEPARPQALTHFFDVIANVRRVEHAASGALYVTIPS